MARTVLVSPAQRMAAEALVEWYGATGRPIADSLRKIAAPERRRDTTPGTTSGSTVGPAARTADRTGPDVGPTPPKTRAVTFHLDASALSVLVSLLEFLDARTGRASSAWGRARRRRTERRTADGQRPDDQGADDRP